MKHTEIEPTTIHMTVRDDSAFLSPYSPSAEPMIDSTVADFIEARAEAAGNRRFCLHIHSNCIQDDEEEVYRRAISRYFRDSIATLTHSLRRESIIAAILATLGILTLFLMLFLEGAAVTGVWLEVVDIVAWVLLWEATDIVLLHGHAERHRLRRLCALRDMQVVFHRETAD